MTSPTSYPPRKKKRRLKKSVRTVLGIVSCTLAFGLACMLPTTLESMARTPDLPVPVSLFAREQTSKTASSPKSETDSKTEGEKLSSEQTSSSSEQDSQSEKKLPYKRDDGMTVYAPAKQGKTVILLDPGHGNLDPGNVAVNETTGEEYYEKDINLSLAKKVAKKLQETNPNLDVQFTRTSDDFDFAGNVEDLIRRVDMQNDLKESTGLAYYISIHCNAMPTPNDPTSGYSFYVKPGDDISSSMADLISSRLQDQSWSTNQGTLETIGNNALHVISFSPVHAMLIETGYMTEPTELAGLLDEKTTDKIAAGIAAGISDYIMEHPEAADTPCPEQVIPGVVNPSKPNGS